MLSLSLPLSLPIPAVIITGASSGVRLYAAQALAHRGWFVVMACHDLQQAERAAQALGIPAAACGP